ncbi:MAG TPA: ATP-dependent metallopeptidase FtsH/Yme1/Tma family protein, partial [Nocardioidaceae bacterium]
MKRWFRGPWLWVVLFAILILIVVDMVSKSDGSEQYDTSKMISTIKAGDVSELTLVDGDQRIEATLDDGTKVTSNWAAAQGPALFKTIQQAQDDGKIQKTYNVEVPKPSLLWSFLGTIFPILLIVL